MQEVECGQPAAPSHAEVASGAVTSGDTQHPRPFDKEFYWRARGALMTATVAERRVLRLPGPCVVRVRAGEVLRIALADGPQIVGLQAFAAEDPDERIWCHETFLLEGLWLTRYTRLWSTMARYRPLLTCLEDTVVMPRLAGGHLARHHVIPAGWSTPAQWTAAGGPPGCPSIWEQHAAALEQLGLSADLAKDEVSLFQCSRIEPGTQQVTLLPSQARRGDYVALLAECDVVVILGLNPYVDGSRPASDLGDLRPRAVVLERMAKAVEPLLWPYPGVAYPDLGLYLGSDGTRLDVPVPTPGREAATT